MTIDYMTDIHGLHYAGKVVSDPEYSSIPADLRDDLSEQRILTTIEVLRSHLEIIESRTEANLLLESIARLTARIGSGGFVYDLDRVSVEGNIVNPTFAAGAALSITVGGSTVPAASPSGGNIDVVIAELNLALAGATAEDATFTTLADPGDGTLAPKYFTVNGPVGSPTDDYYVYYNHTGEAGVEKVQVPAASTFVPSTTPGGPLVEGEYWLTDTPGLDYFTWYNVLPTAEVTDIAFKAGGSYTPELAAGVLETTVGDYWDLDDNLGGFPGQLWRIWYDVNDPLIQDLTMPPLGTLAGPGWPGGGAPGNYFTLEVPFNHPAFPGFYVWFDLVYAGGNLDPGPPGLALPALAGYTGLRIELTVGPAPTDVALVTEILFNPGNTGGTAGTTGIIPDPAAGGEFAGSTTLGAGVLEVWNSTPGANALSTDGFAAGLAVWTGVAAPPILTPGPPPPAGPNLPPPLGGRTLIPVLVSQLDTPTTVAGNTDTALGVADVTSPVTGAGVLTVTQNTAGAVVPIANTSAGLVVAPPPFISTPGNDANTVPTGGSTGGRTAIQVDVNATDTAGGAGVNTVAKKTAAAMNNVDIASLEDGVLDEIFVIMNAIGTPSTTLDFDAGVTPLPPVFLGVDPVSTDPAPGPANKVVVDIDVGDSDTDVGLKTRTAIGIQASTHFSVGGAGNQVVVTNKVGGNAPNATAGDSGFALAITPGTAGTPSAIEAYKVGTRIGFRNTAGNEDTPFTLALGTGGILESAGIAPGDYLHRKLEVANQGRDRALTVYEGQKRDPIL